MWKGCFSFILAVCCVYFLLNCFLVNSKAQTTPSVYWGAFIRGSTGNPTYPPDYRDCPWDIRTCDLFETNAGKRVSIIHFGQPWKDSSGSLSTFPSTPLNTIRTRGSIPMLNWGSWQLGGGVNQPNFKLTNITRGDYDSYITQFARSAAAWNHPFFIRFNHEMNIGGQFPWNYSDTWIDRITGFSYRNTPNDFIKMWRHVVDIFRREGATNVTWVWCPNIYYRSGSNALPFMQSYPGDAYVDWNCLDGYNHSTSMIPFSTLFTDSYNVMQQKVIGTDTICSNLVTDCNPKVKPIMIGEWASVEAGDGGTKKANWIKDAFLTQLPNNFPAIKAVVWFNWNSHPNQIIESTTISLTGFKIAVNSPYYAANNFANISTSPIEPLLASPKLGDINFDGMIDIVDIGIIIDNYSATHTTAGADVNNDGRVDIIDIGIVIDNYGR
jgi:hypothetical protein